MNPNIKGTKDILPAEVELWQRLEAVFRSVTALSGYEEIRTPMIEYADLFRKSAGEGSDVVSKEMYLFEDRSGDQICLRPELTAPVARTVLQNTLLRAQPTLRLWYYGPCFRYERPQLGRQRQFHQIGAECIGSPNPEADAEVIILANEIIRQCGIQDFQLHVNTLGSVSSRTSYRVALIDYLQQFRAQLSEDSLRRLETNPLRILDSKDEADRGILSNAPVLTDFLDDESKSHFSQVCGLLDNCRIPYVLNHLLVRGLDYYTHTVFEFKTTALGAQDAIGGGGRYDNLFESLQGSPAPGVGFGIGMERLILLAQKNEQSSETSPWVYIVGSPESTASVIRLAQYVRSMDIRTRYDVQRRSFKAQMKEADKIGAEIVLIIGTDELASNTITLKIMSTGQRHTIENNDVAIRTSLTSLTS